MNVVEAENVHYTYSDGTNALRGVSLRVKRGETVVILGPNGSGKTTLLLILSCLLLPQRGSLKIMGKEVNKKNSDMMRRCVGIVFQNPDDQVIAPTVYDDIAFGLRNLGLNEDDIGRRVNRIIRQLNLENLSNKNPDYLSGGQKKKVAIAGILAMDPEIIIMDEPTSGLDGVSFKSILKIIKKLRGEKTLILSTHDLDFAEAVGDRFLYMNEGKMVHESREIDYSLAELLGIRCYIKGKIFLASRNIDGIKADYVAKVTKSETALEGAILRALEGKKVLLICESGEIEEIRRKISKFPVICEIVKEVKDSVRSIN